MSGHPPYLEYERAEDSWLRKIPAHWEMVRISKLSNKITNGYVGPTRGLFIEAGVPYLQSLHIKRNEIVFSPTYFVPLKWSLSKEKSVLREGDVLIVQTGDVGQVACVPREFEGANCHALIVISVKTEKVCGRFLSLWLTGNCGSSILKSIQTGALHPHLNCGTVRDVCVSIPPLDEQAQIAKFLDYETAKIDALIEKQQQLIALLKEKRQAVISHAVTKGLNPDAPMRDSGVEWLGEVPKHWEVMPIKRIVSVPVTDGPHETPSFIDEGVPFLSAEGISSGDIEFDRIRGFISEELDAEYSKKYSPQMHDIFMVKSGATTGVTAIVETDRHFNIWSPLAVIRCDAATDPHFTLDFLRSRNFQEAVELNWSFGTQQNIGMGVIENLHVARPPLEEAKEIAAHLAEMCSRMDAVSERAKMGIELLQERRTALISAAVTGKIDVRGWKAPDSEPGVA